MRVERLTTDGKRKLAPVFVNAGEIVFAVHETPNLVALKRLKLGDGARSRAGAGSPDPAPAQERLHPNVTGHQFDPAYSADGRYHAFASSAGSPQLVLVIQDLKEKQEHTFRPRDARATARGPSFSPDGKRVVFSLSDLGGHQIASVDVQGKEFKRLTESAGLSTSPAWSPDGKHIAFSSSRDGNFEIYVMDADSGNVRRLTKSPGLDTRPCWSPDGKRLAFTSNRDGRYQIYLMNADGSEQRLVSDGTSKDDYAKWHPDGKRLLMVSEREGKCDLYLMDLVN